MKAKILFLASLLALTGCGGNTDMSALTPGDEVDKASFETAFSVRKILLNSNFHLEVAYSQSEIYQGYVAYSQKIDFAGPKLKVTYNLPQLGVCYFDFSRTGLSETYSFDLYSQDYNEQGQYVYTKQEFSGVTISDSLMGINDLLPATFGVGLTLVTGLSFDDFKLEDGVYQIKNPITIKYYGGDLTFDSLKVSMDHDNPKEVYYRVTSVVEIGEGQTMSVNAESHLYFSNYEGVTVTLPIVE